MYYVTLDTDSRVVEMFCDEHGYPAPPDGAFEISDQQAEQLRQSGFTNWRLVDGKLQPHVDHTQVEQKLSAMFSDQIQQRLDKFATTRRYTSVDSVGKYKDLTDAQIQTLPFDVRVIVQRYRAECEYLALKTAETWANGELLEARVKAGNWPTPGAAQYPSGIAEIEAELPTLDWDEINLS